jgi:hypothetical protein
MASDLSGSIVIHKRAAGISIADAFFPERKQANKATRCMSRQSASQKADHVNDQWNLLQ